MSMTMSDDTDGLRAGSVPAWSGLELRINKMNLFRHLTQTFGVLSGMRDYSTEAIFTSTDRENVGVQTERMDATVVTALEIVKDTTEAIALDAVLNFDSPISNNPPNKFCKTMRRVVKDMLERHEMVFKGMVNKLNLDEDNLFPTFVIVSDELFADGEVNWGRIVAVFAFAVKLAKYYKDSIKPVSRVHNPSETETSHQEKIAMFLGKYAAGKLGQWILSHGGWEAFVEFFPDQGEFEEKMWKGLVFTAIGFVAIGTMMSSR